MCNIPLPCVFTSEAATLDPHNLGCIVLWFFDRSCFTAVTQTEMNVSSCSGGSTAGRGTVEVMTTANDSSLMLSMTDTSE